MGSHRFFWAVNFFFGLLIKSHLELLNQILIWYKNLVLKKSYRQNFEIRIPCANLARTFLADQI